MGCHVETVRRPHAMPSDRSGCQRRGDFVKDDQFGQLRLSHKVEELCLGRFTLLRLINEPQQMEEAVQCLDSVREPRGPLRIAVVAPVVCGPRIAFGFFERTQLFFDIRQRSPQPDMMMVRR